MLTSQERQEIIGLIHKNVVPAVGCTEPIAVALCVAKATERLGCRPETIRVLLSANILKNAMGVGIPGTGMVGLPIAIALGAIIGKSEYQLEVLKDLTPDTLEEGKRYLRTNTIDIRLKENAPDKLYIEVECQSGDKAATAVIAHTHTGFVESAECRVQSAEFPLVQSAECSVQSTTAQPNSELCTLHSALNEKQLTMRLVYDFATTAPLEEIDFILQTKDLNMNAADMSLKGNYGHCLGKTIERPLARGIFGNSIFSHIIAKTSLACDARMGGAMVPVMSNSGSGNQGICATNPVVVYAEENHNTEEELIRALTISHLTAIYIKQSLGALSALCGCVVASTGASCGITYLMGGKYEQVCHAVKNMIANLTGMICDGAKPSCSLKLASATSTALLSALLAIQEEHVTSVEGIVDDDVDKSIHNLTSIGREAMNITDQLVLNIMTNK